jgi:hypothetical protein
MPFMVCKLLVFRGMKSTSFSSYITLATSIGFTSEGISFGKGASLSG